MVKIDFERRQIEGREMARHMLRSWWTRTHAKEDYAQQLRLLPNLFISSIQSKRKQLAEKILGKGEMYILKLI